MYIIFEVHILTVLAVGMTMISYVIGVLSAISTFIFTESIAMGIPFTVLCESYPPAICLLLVHGDPCLDIRGIDVQIGWNEKIFIWYVYSMN